MKHEDIEFLKRLQREIQMQPTCSTREPRYWGIVDKERIYGMDKEYADGWEVVDEEYDVMGKEDDIESVYEYCVNYLDDQDEGDQEILQKLQWALDDKCIEDMVEIINDDLFPATLAYYRNRNFLAQNFLFLTKKECEVFIKDNPGSFEHPSSFCMCAEPHGDYARIIDIIKNTNWYSLETTVNQNGPNNTVIGHVDKLVL
jgi:hypothetical protein